MKLLYFILKQTRNVILQLKKIKREQHHYKLYSSSTIDYTKTLKTYHAALKTYHVALKTYPIFKNNKTFLLLRHMLFKCA